MRYSISDEQFIHDINQANSIPHLIELKNQFIKDKQHQLDWPYCIQSIVDMYTHSIKIVEDRIKYLTDISADEANLL